MCGIVSMVNVERSISPARKKWFANALYVDQLRGPHSTGIHVQPQITKKSGLDMFPPTITYKKALAASDFLQLNRVKDIFTDVDDCHVAIGHNRWATQGASGDDNNAHPFTYGDITMVHNGTLSSRAGLNTYKVVDSESIAVELSVTKPEDYTKVLSQLDGAFTLFWHNTKNNKVYFTRNKERPLFIAKAFSGKTAFFASEEWMITELLDRNGDFWHIDAKKDSDFVDVTEIDVGVLYSIDYTLAEIVIEEEKYTLYDKKVHNRWKTYDYESTYSYDYGSTTKALPKKADKSTSPLGKQPVKPGDYVNLTEFTFYPAKQEKNKIGVVVGSSADIPDLKVVIPNLKEKTADLHKDAWKECESIQKQYPIPHQVPVLRIKVNTVSKTSASKVWTATGNTKDMRVMLAEPESVDSERSPNNFVNTKTKDIAKGNAFLNIDEWLAETADGCTLCGQILKIRDRYDTHWVPVVEGKSEVLKPICTCCNDELDSTTIIN